MLDTMTMTKIAGGLFGALLVFLLGGWVSEEIYAMDKGHHGDDHGQAYVIETGEEDAAEEEEAVDFAVLYAAADAAKGERVFSKCSACHKLVAGENAVGPYLHGVVGRDIDSADGFGYSGALEESADVWTPETLYAFLESPRSWAPGTSMAFNGLKKSEDRVNLIAYLDLTDGDMTELTPAAATQDDASMEAEPASTEEATSEEASTEEAMTETAAVEEDAAPEEEMAEEMAVEPAAEEEAATDEATATETAEVEEAAVSDDASGFAALVAAADVEAGAKVYNKCKACHVLEDGVNRIGPHLYQLVDRDMASVDGFKYSDALTALEGAWTYDELNAFLEKPRDYASGTRMAFTGLKKEEDRAAVIAYIESVSE